MKQKILELINKQSDLDAISIVLVGGWARAQVQKHSDIDILRLYPNEVKEKNEFKQLQGEYFSISNISKNEIEAWFSEAQIAVDVIEGLKAAIILKDENDFFASIQNRAKTFVWNPALQKKADIWASKALKGWVEEANKGLNGLLLNDIGRLLQARYGLSWGLSKVVQVSKGILVSGDNASFDEINQAMKEHRNWVELRKKSFGISNNLNDAVVAGLLLFVETADLLEPTLRKEDQSTINHCKNEIIKMLGKTK